MLHIAPSQVRIRFKRQGAHSSRNRCGGRCARVRFGAQTTGVTPSVLVFSQRFEVRSVHVDRHNVAVLAGRAAGVGGCQGGRAFLQIPGLGAGLRSARDRQRINGVRVAVAVTVVRPTAAITTGPDIDRTQALSALVYAVQESSFGQATGSIDYSNGNAVSLFSQIIRIFRTQGRFNQILFLPVRPSSSGLCELTKSQKSQTERH